MVDSLWHAAQIGSNKKTGSQESSGRVVQEPICAKHRPLPLKEQPPKLRELRGGCVAV